MSAIKIKIKKLYAIYKKKIYTRNLVKEAKEQYAALPEKKRLSKGQRREVIDYYNGLTGKKVPLIWHDLYLSKTGIFDKRVIPNNISRLDILNKANRFDYRDAYADKNMIDYLFPGVNCARPIVKCRNGYYYMEGKSVSRDDVVKRLQNIDNCIIKPTLECHGNGVHQLSVNNGVSNIQGMRIEELLDDYGDNFQIQERIFQHEDLEKLNPSSLNSLRIVTYRSGMDVLVLYSSIRIGRLGSEIDNLDSGGISVVVNNDGTLGKQGYLLKSQNRILSTDTGIILEGYKIPCFDKLISFVKELQMQLPFFNLVGWDVSIDMDGNPVLIEWNSKPGFSQYSYGPALGEYTERIFAELKNVPNSKNKFWD